MSVSEIVQRLERLEEHCKIEATKVARLWGMHHGPKPLDYLNDVPPSPATRPGEAGVRSEAEPWKTYNPLPASLDEKALEGSLQSVRERAISYAKAIDAMAIERESLKARIDYLERDRKFWSMQSAVHEQAANALKARVTASGAAGNSPAVPVSSEPVAYFVKWADKDWGVQDQTFRTLERAQDYIKDEKSEDENPQIVPLYAAPQAAPGWLTEEEREALEWWCRKKGPMSVHQVDAWRESLCKLLARSSPPEVVHPECVFDEFSGCSAVHPWNICAADFRKALAAAGVKVKEVGK